MDDEIKAEPVLTGVWLSAQQLRNEIAKVVGEPGVDLAAPVRLSGRSRATFVWMLPADGYAKNHGFHLDRRTGAASGWEFEAWKPGDRVTLKTYGKAPSRNLMRIALASIDFPGVTQ